MANPLVLGQGKLVEFNVNELNPNIRLAPGVTPRIIIDEEGVPTELARVTMNLEALRNVVWLAATVGWKAISSTNGDAVKLTFNIYKNAITGPNSQLIFSTSDSGERDNGELQPNLITTSLNHVDVPALSPCDVPEAVTYILTAELPEAGGVNDGQVAHIIGPITFIGAQIRGANVTIIPPLEETAVQ